MVTRLIAPRITVSRKSVLLLGPRQTGKSTLCRQLKPDLTIDLADETEYLNLAKNPSLLRHRLAVVPRARLVLVDEIQRVPAILNVIQTIVDKPGGPRFLLTGSSARKLRRGQANLLPGRVILEHLDPLSVLELKGRFDLERALQVGTLPGVYLDERDGTETLGTYAEIYLREEIRAEALTRDLGGFARFLDTAAITSGQWINYSKLSSDAEISRETIRRFYEILVDTLLVFRLSPFTPRLKTSRRLSQRDRFIFVDIGIRNALLGQHRRKPAADQIGPVFEQWLISQVAILNRALRKDWKLSAYRTEAGAEVDLVVETNRKVIGIEIKASRNVRQPDLRGLASLAEMVGRYKPFMGYVAYQGKDRLGFGPRATAVPWDQLLQELSGLD